MDRFCRLAIAASLSLALVSVPAMALAADATYAISGIEYAATETVGSFAGVAVATNDYGTWQATIIHGSLGYSPGAITGSFSLHGKVRALIGTISGTIKQTSGSPRKATSAIDCNKQTFSVNGTLTPGTGSTWAAFVGVILTHYRIWLWGRCITYGATLKGAVSFTGLPA